MPNTPATAQTAAKAASGAITRSISACLRCRTRKTKCDQHFPTCGACAKAKVECVGIDAATGREVPRSYVWWLEKRVEELEAAVGLKGLAGGSMGIPAQQQQQQPQLQQQQQLHAHHHHQQQQQQQHQRLQHQDQQLAVKAEGTGASDGISNGASGQNREQKPLHLRPDIENLVSTVGLVSVTGTSQPSYLGQSSGVSFARLMFATVKLSERPPVHGAPQPPTDPLVHVKPAPFPDREEARRLAEIYFHQANTQTPILFRASYERYLKAVYERVDENQGPPKPLELYFLNMVCAIASAMSSNTDTQPEAYHAAAMKVIDSIFDETNRQNALKGILLLALYSFMRPTAPGVWYLVGAAMRLCIDLGLHQEGCRSNGRFDPLLLDERRRLFWCTYSLDRQICVYLGRPFSLPEEAIKTPFPWELEDEIIKTEPVESLEEKHKQVQASSGPKSGKTIANYIFQLRRLQSEMQTMLYQGAELPRRFETLDQWRSDMADRLLQWFTEVPKTPEEATCNFNFDFIHLNYHQSRLLLYGLSPKSSNPDEYTFKIIEDAAKHIFTVYKRLKETGKINYTWLSCHNLFMAGASYLCALWHCKAVRNNTNIQEIENYTTIILDVLRWMIPKCAAAKGCSEVFDNLQKETVALCRRYYSVSQPQPLSIPVPYNAAQPPAFPRRLSDSNPHHKRRRVDDATTYPYHTQPLAPASQPHLPDIPQFSSPAFPNPAPDAYSATNPQLGVPPPQPPPPPPPPPPPQQQPQGSQQPPQTYPQTPLTPTSTTTPTPTQPPFPTSAPTSLSAQLDPTTPLDLTAESTTKLWEVMTEIGGGAMWDQAFFSGGGEGFGVGMGSGMGVAGQGGGAGGRVNGYGGTGKNWEFGGGWGWGDGMEEWGGGT